MKAKILLFCMLVVAWAISANSAPITLSNVVGDDVTVSGNVVSINDNLDGRQSMGAHGAEFLVDFTGIASIDISYVLATNDSYNEDWSGGGGLYDLFVMNASQDGFILDDPWVDPATVGDYAGGYVTSDTIFSGYSYAVGGTSWTDGETEFFTGTVSFLAEWFDTSESVFMTLGLKTDYDPLYESWGTYTVGYTHEPVPEPTTMILFGTGIVGLCGTSAVRRKKK